MARAGRVVVIGWVVLVGLMLAGCKRPVVKDYARPLPPGVPALRKITDPAELPDLRPAFYRRSAGLMQALALSEAWFDKPSSRLGYPVQGITHEQARASVRAFRRILMESNSAEEFAQRVLREFDVYTSVGWDGSGVVFFTGYYAPIVKASRERTEVYRYPLYQRPPDLEKDPVTGQTLGRRVGGQLKPYPTRAQIEMYPDRLGLVGRELAWLADKFQRYVVQVQGSAKLELTDGGVMHVGYAADNGREYTSVARLLVAEGKLDPNRAGLPAVKAYFAEHPEELDAYLNRNERYVFFQEYPAENWPAGSLGFRVTAFASLATDKSIYPRGCVTLVSTEIPSASGGRQKFYQFMVDQDTGGAIRAPGRADIFMGIGPGAEAVAGQQAAEGRLYYLVLKPERVRAWSG